MDNELIREMARKPHFVAYHGIPVTDKNGEVRTSKVPMYGVKTATGKWALHKAKTDTPTTWGTYEQAKGNDRKRRNVGLNSVKGWNRLPAFLW